MAVIPSWVEDPESWDTLVIGDERLPGVVVVNADTQRDFDVKKPKGKKKATVKSNGDPPRKANITWQFPDTEWGRAQEVIAAVLEPRKDSKSLDPLAVVHPRFALWNIKTVVVEKLAGPNIARGLATIVISVLEFEKPKPAPAISGVAKGGAGAPPDYLLAALQQQLNQINGTLEELEHFRDSLAGDPEAAAQVVTKINQLKGKKAAIQAQMNKPGNNPDDNL